MLNKYIVNSSVSIDMLHFDHAHWQYKINIKKQTNHSQQIFKHESPHMSNTNMNTSCGLCNNMHAFDESNGIHSIQSIATIYLHDRKSHQTKIQKA